MEYEQPFGIGAHDSPYDPRTLIHNTNVQAAPVTEGGVSYLPEEIEMQAKVGICTAISLTQNAKKATGRAYSADFQYLCQKRYFDLNSEEGSSIFNALRVGKLFGFLPVEFFVDKNGVPYMTQADREGTYESYWTKLNSIPESEMTRLKALCINKLAGYASVPTDPGSLTVGISASKAGLLTMYRVGLEWWTPSWQPKDIDPLRPPQVVTGGHAMTKCYFNLSTNLFTIANTWSAAWNVQGSAHINYLNYQCREAWIPYYDTVPIPATPNFIFTQDMAYGQTSNDIIQLQKRLIAANYSIPGGATGYYGDQTAAAVLAYQISNIKLSWFEQYVTRGRICGPKTRAALNRI